MKLLKWSRIYCWSSRLTTETKLAELLLEYIIGINWKEFNENVIPYAVITLSIGTCHERQENIPLWLNSHFCIIYNHSYTLSMHAARSNEISAHILCQVIRRQYSEDGCRHGEHRKNFTAQLLSYRLFCLMLLSASLVYVTL